MKNAKQEANNTKDASNIREASMGEKSGTKDRPGKAG
jgi:hypothetical protein